MDSPIFRQAVQEDLKAKPRRKRLASVREAAGPDPAKRTLRLGAVVDVSAGKPQAAPLPEGFSLGEPRGTGRDAKAPVQGSGRLAPEDTQRIAESFLTPEGRQETQTQKRTRDTTTREGALAALDKVRLGRVTRGEEGNDPVRQRFLDRVDARIADQGQIDPEWLKEELRLVTSAQSSKEVDEAMALPFGPTEFAQTQEQKDWEESGVVRKIVEPMGKAVGDTLVGAYRTGLKGIARLTGQNPAAYEGDLEGTEGAKMARGAAGAAPYFVPGLGHAAGIEGGYRAGLTLAGGHGAWKAVNEIVPVEMVVKGLSPKATTEERTAAIVAALAMGHGARKPVGKAARSGAEALGRLSDRLRTFAEPKAREFADTVDALAKADPDGVEAAWADPELQATFRKAASARETPPTGAIPEDVPLAGARPVEPTVAPEPPQTGASGTIPPDVRTEGQPGGVRGGLREAPGTRPADGGGQRTEPRANEPPNAGGRVQGQEPPVVEAAPEPTTTGIAHADTGAWRKEAGLDPYVKTRYKVNDYSQEAVDRGHADDALKIADQVNSGSKTSADRFEQEGLRLGFHKVKSEVRDLEAAKSDAVESGDAMALAEAESRLADAVGRGDRITKALDKVGSEAGGTLGGRAYDLIDEGDSLDLRRKAQSQSGTKVTEAQQKVLDEAAAKVKELEDRVSRLETVTSADADAAVKRAGPRAQTGAAHRISKSEAKAAVEKLTTIVRPGQAGSGLGGFDGSWTPEHQQALRTVVRYVVQSGADGAKAVHAKVVEMLGHDPGADRVNTAIVDEMGRPRAVTRQQATARARLNAARRQSRRAVDKIVEEAKEAQRTFAQKAAREVAGVLSVPRRMMTFLDDSAVGRQGLFLAMTHPQAAGKAFVRQWEVVKKDGFDTTMGRLMDDPVYDEYKGMGGYLADPRNGVREEGFVSSVLDRIPGLSHAMRGSEELMAAYLNVLRLESYKALRSGLEVGGHEATVPELRWAAQTVNVASGRGIGPGGGGKAQQAANQFFFSPQLLAARLRMATGDPMVRGASVSPRAFALGSAEYAKYLAARAVLTTLMAGVGGKTATDVKDKEFGQTRFGKLKVDTSGGMDAAAGMVWGNLADLTENAVNAAQGRPLRRSKYADAPMDRALRFFGNRTAPIVSYAKGLASGTDFKGDPFQPGREAAKMLGPIHVVNQIDGSLAKEGATASDRAKMAVLEIFGFSTGFYEKPSGDKSSSSSPTTPPKARKRFGAVK